MQRPVLILDDLNPGLLSKYLLFCWLNCEKFERGEEWWGAEGEIVRIRIKWGGRKGKEDRKRRRGKIRKRQHRRNYTRYSKTRYIRRGNRKLLKNKIPKKSKWNVVEKQVQKKSQLKAVEKRYKRKAKGNRLHQYKETRSGVTITSSGICNAVRRYRRFGITWFYNIPPVLQDITSSTIPATSYYHMIIDRTIKEYNTKFTPNVSKLLLFVLHY